MSVGLPPNIQISANFSLTPPLTESANEGGITILIRNGTILKHDVTSTNFSDQFSKISYSDSKVSRVTYFKVPTYICKIISC